jgi:hypothetical protein
MSETQHKGCVLNRATRFTKFQLDNSIFELMVMHS